MTPQVDGILGGLAMEAVQHDTRTLDGPTLTAAVATLLFAIGAGALLSYLPTTGTFAGALDALKNLIYVLTVPFFDIVRRLLVRRAAAIKHVPPNETPSLLAVAFVSALVLFVIVEALSWLTGFGMGGVCALLAQSITGVDIGSCIALGLNVLGAVIVAPIMLALGFANGWIWQRMLPEGFATTLAIFAVAVAVLFALDFAILMQGVPDVAKAFQEQMSAIGPIRQIGTQVALLGVSTVIGFGARRLWGAIAGAFG
jgi:hypothetical protein